MSKKRSISQNRIYAVVKRVLDIFFSVTLIALLAFFLFLIWLAVRLDSPGKGIFGQIRVGRDGRLFTCYKFRTMYRSAPPCRPSAQFDNVDEYITPVGRFLRRTSLDELPQLFNVLKGDMSLVGPRPLILEESEVHTGRRESGAYGLRPGITGLSQVRGRNNLTNAQKVELDAEYLWNFGFLQDVRIIGMTVLKVITGDGISKKRI